MTSSYCTLEGSLKQKLSSFKSDKTKPDVISEFNTSVIQCKNMFVEFLIKMKRNQVCFSLKKFKILQIILQTYMKLCTWDFSYFLFEKIALSKETNN